MKRGFIKWLFASLGYLVYTLVLLVVLLWVLFPVDSFRLWLQAELQTFYPDMVWEIESVRQALPPGLRISGISVGDKEDNKEPLITIRSIELTPPWLDLLPLNRNIPVQYTVRTLGGTVRGQARVNKQKNSLQCTGAMKDIQLNRLEKVWNKLNRPVSGTLSGNFEYAGTSGNFLQGDLLADLEVREGKIGLMQPILGLQSLEFSQAKTRISMKDAVVTVEGGEVESRLLAVSSSGTISLSDSLATSGVEFQGFFEPRPELLGRIQDKTTVSLIRNQLQDGKLSYTLKGSLLEPGILFQGVSGVIDGIIEGGMK